MPKCFYFKNQKFLRFLVSLLQTFRFKNTEKKFLYTYYGSLCAEISQKSLYQQILSSSSKPFVHWQKICQITYICLLRVIKLFIFLVLDRVMKGIFKSEAVKQGFGQVWYDFHIKNKTSFFKDFLFSQLNFDYIH